MGLGATSTPQPTKRGRHQLQVASGAPGDPVPLSGTSSGPDYTSGATSCKIEKHREMDATQG